MYFYRSCFWWQEDANSDCDLCDTHVQTVWMVCLVSGLPWLPGSGSWKPTNCLFQLWQASLTELATQETIKNLNCNFVKTCSKNITKLWIVNVMIPCPMPIWYLSMSWARALPVVVLALQTLRKERTVQASIHHAPSPVTAFSHKDYHHADRRW